VMKVGGGPERFPGGRSREGLQRKRTTIPEIRRLLRLGKKNHAKGKKNLLEKAGKKSRKEGAVFYEALGGMS